MEFFEQETEGILKFVLEQAGNPTAYYGTIPEEVTVPAIFISAPDVVTAGDTLSTYRADYEWNICFFGQTKEQAYELANKVLASIAERRNLIPYNDTEREGKKREIRIYDPILQKLEDGTVQLKLSFTCRRAYAREKVQKMQSYQV